MTHQQKQRQRALDNYYSNPSVCLNCRKIIQVRDWEYARDARRRKFCDKSCAASFNNKGVNRTSSLKIKPDRPPRLPKEPALPKEKRVRWTKEMTEPKFKEIAQGSRSIKEILTKLGQSSSRMNYSWVRERLVEYGIDTSSWYTTDGKWHKEIPLIEIVVENSTYSGNKLKKRLIRDGLLKNECSICGQMTAWNGQPLVMVIDHINGINTDHRLENLRLVCPNCDSQLPTYKSRNKKVKKGT